MAHWTALSGVQPACRGFSSCLVLFEQGTRLTDMHGVSIRDMAGLSSELNAHRFVHKMDIVTSHLAKPI